MNLEKVLAKELPPVEQYISAKDCMLYSLGIGLGADPTDPKHLPFVFEKDLRVFPSQSVVIAHPGAWVTDPELGINWIKLLHAEQTIAQHVPLRPNRTYVGNYKVLGVVDKGKDKGAILYQEKSLTDQESGDLAATVTSSYFLRGDGGCGSSGFIPPASAVIPERPADRTTDIKIAANAALIYRLSGDYNPIHADPKKAREAGFDRPILHGLCSFGVAARAVLDTYCAFDPDGLEFLGLRFSAPVYPGETISLEFWKEGEQILFRAFVKERSVKVLDQGLAKLR